MQFFDAAVIGGTRTTEAGYLVADVRIARTGLQLYSGREVGRSDLDTVRVYRPEDQVFHRDAMKSLAGIPVTLDHPSELIDAGNWREESVGEVGDEIARDGEFVRVPMMLRDSSAIAVVKDGKRQLSVGYVCDLDWTAGSTPDGQSYDARQTNIRANHLAIVAAGRAGPECRVGDKAARTHEDKMTEKTLTSVTVDGIPVETTDQGRQVIETLKTRIADAEKALGKANSDHTEAIKAKDKELAGKDAEIDALKVKVLDAKALDTLVKDRADVIAKAQKIAPDLTTDGLDVTAIRRAAVKAKLGDTAVDGKSDDYVEARFDTLLDSAGPVVEVFRAGMSTQVSDAEKARNAWLAAKDTAWKGKEAH